VSRASQVAEGECTLPKSLSAFLDYENSTWGPLLKPGGHSVGDICNSHVCTFTRGCQILYHLYNVPSNILHTGSLPLFSRKSLYQVQKKTSNEQSNKHNENQVMMILNNFILVTYCACQMLET
jgi:hypothetical protein